jgi:hypothetical protein
MVAESVGPRQAGSKGDSNGRQESKKRSESQETEGRQEDRNAVQQMPAEVKAKAKSE